MTEASQKGPCHDLQQIHDQRQQSLDVATGVPLHRMLLLLALVGVHRDWSDAMSKCNQRITKKSKSKAHAHNLIIQNVQSSLDKLRGAYNCASNIRSALLDLLTVIKSIPKDLEDAVDRNVQE